MPAAAVIPLVALPLESRIGVITLFLGPRAGVIIFLNVRPSSEQKLGKKQKTGPKGPRWGPKIKLRPTGTPRNPLIENRIGPHFRKLADFKTQTGPDCPGTFLLGPGPNAKVAGLRFTGLPDYWIARCGQP